MPIGKESNQHRAMVEGLELRIRKLFPNASVTLGQKIHPVDLKPDIFVRHSDGRQWAYEMIKGNQSRAHLEKNHAKYQEFGIHDFWILWEDLGPKNNPPDQHQGPFSAFQASPYRAKLNTLYRAILNAHSHNRSLQTFPLYAFTLKQVGNDVENLPELFKTLSIGVRIYEFKNYDESDASYVKNFLSLSEIGFDDDGFLIAEEPDTLDPKNFEGFLQERGMVAQEGYIPSNIISAFNGMANDPQIQNEMMHAILEQLFLSLTAEERAELSDFFKSGRYKNIQPLKIDGANLGDKISLSNSGDLQNLSNAMKSLSASLEAQELPDSLKKLLLPFLNTKSMDSISDVMKWQEMIPPALSSDVPKDNQENSDG